MVARCRSSSDVRSRADPTQTGHGAARPPSLRRRCGRLAPCVPAPRRVRLGPGGRARRRLRVRPARAAGARRPRLPAGPGRPDSRAAGRGGSPAVLNSTIVSATPITDDEPRWLEELAGDGPRHDAAVERLHGLLLRAARFEVRRRIGNDQDGADLAAQAADDATVAVLAK